VNSARIKFDDQLFLDGQTDVFSCWQRLDDTLLAIHIERQPMRLSLSCHAFKRIFYSRLAELILAGGNHVSLLQYIRRYVDALSVDGEVVVPYHLPGRASGRGEAHAINNVIEPQFEVLQEVFAGDTLFTLRRFKVDAELLFQNPIKPFDLLLFPQLRSILGEFFPPLAVLSRQVRPPIDGAFSGFATIPF